MKKLAALISIAALGMLPVIAHAHEEIFQTDLPSPYGPACLMPDCCDPTDNTRPDFVNGLFTAACELLNGPDVNRPTF